MDSHSSPQAHSESEPHYKAHDTLDETAKAALVGGASGLFIAAIRNALAKRNVGAFSVFTRGAPLIGLAGMTWEKE